MLVHGRGVSVRRCTPPAEATLTARFTRRRQQKRRGGNAGTRPPQAVPPAAVRMCLTSGCACAGLRYRRVWSRTGLLRPWGCRAEGRAAPENDQSLKRSVIGRLARHLMVTASALPDPSEPGPLPACARCSRYRRRQDFPATVPRKRQTAAGAGARQDAVPYPEAGRFRRETSARWWQAQEVSGSGQPCWWAARWHSHSCAPARRMRAGRRSGADYAGSVVSAP